VIPSHSLIKSALVALLLLTGTQLPAQSASELKPLPRFEHPDVKHASGLVDQGHYQDAIAELQALSAKDPQQKGVAHLLGVAYYKSRDFAHSMNALQQAMTEDPDDKEAVQLLGLSYYFAGRPKEAIPLLEKVQSWFPHANVDASYVLGVCYIQTLNYDQARRAFANTYGVPPDSPASHLFLARMLLRLNFDPIAETEAKKAIELDPKLPLAHYLLGELYIFKSRIPEAIQELETEMKINPGYAGTYDRLADAYTRVMRWDDAERLLQRSLWLDANATGPYVLMGKVLLKKGEPALAARSLERAISMDPNNYMGHYLLGQAYTALGKREDGERELQLSQKLQAAQSHSQVELR
jgi:tetratricopeptide (TPR) repeat protein